LKGAKSNLATILLAQNGSTKRAPSSGWIPLNHSGKPEFIPFHHPSSQNYKQLTASDCNFVSKSIPISLGDLFEMGHKYNQNIFS